MGRSRRNSWGCARSRISRKCWTRRDSFVSTIERKATAEQASTVAFFYSMAVSAMPHGRDAHATRKNLLRLLLFLLLLLGRVLGFLLAGVLRHHGLELGLLVIREQRHDFALLALLNRVDLLV